MVHELIAGVIRDGLGCPTAPNCTKCDSSLGSTACYLHPTSHISDRRVLGYSALQHATPKGEDRPVCPVT
jgi:hypothetical protein